MKRKLIVLLIAVAAVVSVGQTFNFDDGATGGKPTVTNVSPTTGGKPEVTNN